MWPVQGHTGQGEPREGQLHKQTQRWPRGGHGKFQGIALPGQQGGRPGRFRIKSPAQRSSPPLCHAPEEQGRAASWLLTPGRVPRVPAAVLTEGPGTSPAAAGGRAGCAFVLVRVRDTWERLAVIRHSQKRRPLFRRCLGPLRKLLCLQIRADPPNGALLPPGVRFSP